MRFLRPIRGPATADPGETNGPLGEVKGVVWAEDDAWRSGSP